MLLTSRRTACVGSSGWRIFFTAAAVPGAKDGIRTTVKPSIRCADGGAGGGLTAALEILINSPRVKKLILEGDTTKIPGAIQSSRPEGMQTFNQGLTDLVKSGKVEEAEAIRCSAKPDELKMNLKGIFSGTSAMRRSVPFGQLKRPDLCPQRRGAARAAPLRTAWQSVAQLNRW